MILKETVHCSLSPLFIPLSLTARNLALNTVVHLLDCSILSCIYSNFRVTNPYSCEKKAYHPEYRNTLWVTILFVFILPYLVKTLFSRITGSALYSPPLSVWLYDLFVKRLICYNVCLLLVLSCLSWLKKKLHCMVYTFMDFDQCIELCVYQYSCLHIFIIPQIPFAAPL